MKNSKNNIAYAKLLNKCWEDPAYLEKFRADPAAALAEFGITAPAGARFHIVAPEEMKPSTQEDVYLYYIPKPEVANLDDRALDQVAGGDENDESGEIILAQIAQKVAVTVMPSINTSVYVMPTVNASVVEVASVNVVIC